ncbi:MAG: hypothetical protein ACQCXQ_09820 [Verrucomicrobiales bacterium]
MIERAASARARLETDAAALRSKLDVPHRIKSSLTSNPGTWVAGSMASGLAASLLLRSKARKPKKHRKFSSKLFGLTLTAARPMLKIWLANLAKQWLAEMAARQMSGRGHFSQPTRKPSL